MIKGVRLDRLRESVYVGIDPGQDVGFAGFDANGNPLSYGYVACTKGDIIEFIEFIGSELSYAPLRAVICETFRLNPNYDVKKGGQVLEVVQIIGALKLWTYEHAIDFVGSSTRIKPVAYIRAGLPQAKNHKDSHWRDAYVHAYEWMFQQGITKPKVEPIYKEDKSNAGGR